MNTTLRLEALLVSGDSMILRVVPRLLDHLGIGVTLCASSEAGAALLSRHKFDAVLVDCDSESGSREILRSLRKSSSNKKIVAFALAGEPQDRQLALRWGADFVLAKPLQPDQISSSLQAAYGSMLSERRRYFRQSVNLPVRLHLNSCVEIRAQITDLSQSGLGLKAPVALQLGETVGLQFAMPGRPLPVAGKARIVWADNKGYAGVRFLRLSRDLQEYLTSWLAEKFARQFKPPRIQGPLDSFEVLTDWTGQVLPAGARSPLESYPKPGADVARVEGK